MNATKTSALLHSIKEAALHFGFDHVAAASLEIPPRDQAAYSSWCASGGAAEMSYMTRDPEKRIHPASAFPEAKSALSFGVSYYQGPFPEKPGPGYGRVARYAWGLDYHPVILDRLEKLVAEIRPLFGARRRAAFAVDTKPLLERAVAESAGLGFIGKNTVLIVPRKSGTGFHVGSWVFLAEIVLDIPIEELVEVEGVRSPVSDTQREVSDTGDLTPSTSGCGGCTKCLTACPTDAFERPYSLKAERCISYLTIENKGGIPTEMRAKLSDWIFGCDVCQEVCPFNARALEARWPEFRPERGAGPWVSLQEIFEIENQATFQKKFGHTPLSRPKRRGLLRNACVAAGNSGDRSLVPFLEKFAGDADPLLKDHALWALSQLS